MGGSAAPPSARAKIKPCGTEVATGPANTSTHKSKPNHETTNKQKGTQKYEKMPTLSVNHFARAHGRLGIQQQIRFVWRVLVYLSLKDQFGSDWFDLA